MTPGSFAPCPTNTCLRPLPARNAEIVTPPERPAPRSALRHPTVKPRSFLFPVLRARAQLPRPFNPIRTARPPPDRPEIKEFPMATKARLKDQPPSIDMLEADFDTLDRLVGDLPGSGPAGLLQQELDRAKVHAPSDMPKGVVTMNRWLHFTDGQGADVRRVQLVLPRDADIDAGKVSILSYVGAGLIGLCEGESIDWPAPSGEMRRLSVIMVEDEDPIQALTQ